MERSSCLRGWMSISRDNPNQREYPHRNKTHNHGGSDMAKSTINELSSLVAQLHQAREQHLSAIAEIDDVFARFGVTAGKSRKRRRRFGRPGRPGRPKKATTKAATSSKRAGTQRRKRRKFRTTANEMVLAAIKKAGAKGATGAQISSAWRAAGRPGDAYNTLSTLSKEKRIKRHQVTGERGSRYTLG
jgi:hypothetical protein